jgi:hypothetical protein
MRSRREVKAGLLALCDLLAFRDFAELGEVAVSFPEPSSFVAQHASVY